MARTRKQVSAKPAGVGKGKVPKKKAPSKKSRGPLLKKGKKGSREPERKKRRSRPGMRALREIRKYQKSTTNLIRKAPFARLCREILADVQLCKTGDVPYVTHVTKETLEVLQVSPLTFTVPCMIQHMLHTNMLHTNVHCSMHDTAHVTPNTGVDAAGSY
jgi:hypothetical protein